VLVIGLVAVLVVAVLLVALWRLVGAARANRPSRISRSPQHRPLAPDDDPDFLRELSRRPRSDDDSSN
jgi:hypothetical protein